jgi:hypothetical protein
MIRVNATERPDDSDECESVASSGVRQASFQKVLREAMEKNTDVTIYAQV